MATTFNLNKRNHPHLYNTVSIINITFIGNQAYPSFNTTNCRLKRKRAIKTYRKASALKKKRISV